MASSTLIVSLNASLSLAKSTQSTLYYTSSMPNCSCSINLSSKSFKFNPFSSFSQLGFPHFSHWNGLKHLGISISPKPQKIGKGAKCRGKVVYASLFGVGAPEALVIGVVALLVFGPKGLAEVARNLGKTLRAFQPTIKELQEVSREFKNTLEREISLDDDPTETKNTSVSNTTNPNLTSSTSSSEESQTVPMVEPNGAVSSSAEGDVPSKAYSSEDYLKITEEQLAARQEALSSSPESQVESQVEPESEPQASAVLQQDVVPSSPETSIESESQTQAVPQDVASSPPESTIEPESQPQVVQETANAATSAQKPENEL